MAKLLGRSSLRSRHQLACILIAVLMYSVAHTIFMVLSFEIVYHPNTPALVREQGRASAIIIDRINDLLILEICLVIPFDSTSLCED